MQNLISFLNTENELFCNILTFPLAFLEYFVYIYFINSFFNLNVSKIQSFKAIFICSILFATIRILVPFPFYSIIIFIIIIPLIAFLLNISRFTSFITISVFVLITALVEHIINFFVSKVFISNIFISASTPLYRICFNLFLYCSLFLILFAYQYFSSKTNIFLEFTKKGKLALIALVSFTLLVIIPNYIFLSILQMNLPTGYIIYNILASFVFFLIGIYTTHKSSKLQITQRELETANLYNSTLSKLVDSNRAFRHDIANIVNSIGGFIELNDMDGLKNYYNTGLLPEIKKSNNLSLLNPDVINSPPLFGLLLAKYNYADSLNVKVELNSFFDYSTINMNIFDFVKIFGILLDNAIEAASKCDNKFVSIHITIDFYNRKQIFKISNTFLDNNIDIDKIFEKDFSTKKIKSGFGLWEVKQLLKKYSNVKLLPSKNDIYFTQKLEIYF